MLLIQKAIKNSGDDVDFKVYELVVINNYAMGIGKVSPSKVDERMQDNKDYKAFVYQYGENATFEQVLNNAIHIAIDILQKS